MNILVFSPTPIYPRDAGNRLRAGWIIDKLREFGYRVIFIYFGQEGITPLKAKKISEMVDRFEYVHYDWNKRRKINEDETWLIDDWYQEDIDNVLIEIKNTERIDLVFCNYVWQSRIFKHFHQATKVIDTHDVMGDRHLMLDLAGIKRNFFYCSKEEETKGLNRADIIVGIQESETEYFRRQSYRPVVTIGMTFEKSNSENSLSTSFPTTPLRVGYFASDNLINESVINKFIDDYIKNNDYYFYKLVIGGGISSKIRKFKHIEVIGVVSDPKKFYDKVDVIINPMTTGTGLKIKTIEGLAYGKPVVGTNIAYQGLDTIHEFHKLNRSEDINIACKTIATDQAVFSDLASFSKNVYLNYQKKVNDQFEALFGLASYPLLHSRRRPTLFVTHANFWDNSFGSHIRIRWILKTISEIAKVSLLYLGELSCEEVGDKIKAIGLNVEVLNFDKITEQNNLQENKKVPAKFIENNCYNVKERDVNRFINAISKVNPEVCFFEYLDYSYLSHYLPVYTSVVVDTHDSKYLRKLSFVEAGLIEFLDKRTAQIVLDDEVSALNRVDCVLAITKDEHVFFKSILTGPLILCTPTPIEIDPNVSLNKSLHLTKNKDLLNIGFVGGSSEHNVVSINWFLNNVLPSLHEKKFNVHIFGNVCEKIKITKSNLDKIFLHGYTDSHHKIYDVIDIMINPCFAGSGQKIKTIESIVYGVPVIGSSEAFSGFDLDYVNSCQTNYDFIRIINSIILDRGEISSILDRQSEALRRHKLSTDMLFDQLAVLISSISKPM